MVVFNDRTQVTKVKMKDHKLSKEIIDTIESNIVLLPDKRIAQIKQMTIYNDLIVPNKKILSKMKDINGRSILHHACVQNRKLE